MRNENESSSAASFDTVAQIHNEVVQLLLAKLRDLNANGEFDNNVVNAALKLLKEEGVQAFVERHPLSGLGDAAELIDELDGLDLTFLSK